MKTIAAVLMISVMMACSDNKKAKEEMTQLKTEVEALKSENVKLKTDEKKLKASVNEYNKLLKEIEHNLAEINKSKDMVAKLNQEVKDGNRSLSQGIEDHIVNIKALMENSRLKIVAMDKSMNQLRKESNGKNEELLALDSRIKGLTGSLLAKDQEIELLDDQLDEMEELYQIEAEYVAELKEILNRAYFISASEKDLKSMGVMTREGGFIGIGRVKIIKANFPDTVFTQIKKDEKVEFQLTGKKSNLISLHPEGSYEWITLGEQVHRLTIKDQTAFWKNGNYLVIQTEK